MPEENRCSAGALIRTYGAKRSFWRTGKSGKTDQNSPYSSCVPTHPGVTPTTSGMEAEVFPGDRKSLLHDYSAVLKLPHTCYYCSALLYELCTWGQLRSDGMSPARGLQSLQYPRATSPTSSSVQSSIFESIFRPPYKNCTALIKTGSADKFQPLNSYKRRSPS